MTKSVKQVVFKVGVATMLFPAFNVVNAQQYGESNPAQSANIVLQIQTLQAEIADLRDMIERQNYQIRLLKKQLDASKQADTTATPDQPGQNTSNDNFAVAQNAQTDQSPVVDELPQQQGQLQAPQQQGANPDLISATEGSGNVAVAGSVLPETVSNTSQQQTATPTTTGTDSQYLPDAGATNNAVANGGVVVEERTLDPRDTVYSAKDFPPVDEVAVGSARTQQAQPDNTQNMPETATGQTIEAVATQPVQTLPAGTQADNQVGSNGTQPVGQTPVVQTNTPVVLLPEQKEVSVDEPTVVNQTPPVIQPVETTLPANSAPQTTGAQETAGQETSIQEVTTQLPAEIQLSEPEYYQEGFELLKQSNHSGAVEVFQKQIAAYPNGDLADDAYYWIAESMYVNRRLNVSKENFKIIIERYKNSPRLPDAMLKTAYIEQEQGNKIEARLLLQEIVQLHPSSNAAISAKNRLEQLN